MRIIHATYLIIIHQPRTDNLLPPTNRRNFLLRLMEKVWEIHKRLIYGTFPCELGSLLRTGKLIANWEVRLPSSQIPSKPRPPTRIPHNSLISHTLSSTTQTKKGTLTPLTCLKTAPPDVTRYLHKTAPRFPSLQPPQAPQTRSVVALHPASSRIIPHKTSDVHLALRPTRCVFPLVGSASRPSAPSGTGRKNGRRRTRYCGHIYAIRTLRKVAAVPP